MSSEASTIDHVFKILLIGDAGVGKSRYKTLINIIRVTILFLVSSCFVIKQYFASVHRWFFQ